MKKPFTFMAGGLLLAGIVYGSGCGADDAYLRWAREAASPNPQVAASAREGLREAGPRGLALLLQTHQAAVNRFKSPGFRWAAAPPEDQRIRDAIDAVAMQRDAYASGLYWHTDWNQALEAARKTGKPVLSLRLLGRLNEEMSCANSRFFRVYLYPDPQIARLLRDQWVLHWETVRPVPVMTVDFGDGRTLVRPVTGNSIHYFFDGSGQMLDALPGLYSPKAFAAQIQTVLELHQGLLPLEGPARREVLTAHHQQRSKELAAVMAAVTAAAGHASAPSARKIGVSPAAKLVEQHRPDASFWTAWAAREKTAGTLSPESRFLILAKEGARLERPSALEAGAMALSKFAVESPLLTQFRAAELMLAEETLQNEHLLHATIHNVLAGGQPMERQQFNAWVYQNLFRMPLDDPWLGLDPPAISGIEEGLSTASR
jgi:hypothetical protein